MTIKELENRTGMTRANIRFYEGEGLVSPKRLDNGYRDYSEEDARTLEKIKLLRQLQLDIDTIRKIQQGRLTLEQALFVQTTRLEGDKALIERAVEVCRELEQSEAPPAPPEDGAGKEWDGEPRACYCPWQRLFARALDTALYRIIFGWLWAVLFWNQGFFLSTGLFGWLLDLAMLAFTLAVEPLWLHYLGWTPGKLLFGLKLRNQDGRKLTIAQGWERSWRVFQDGYGYNIPFWDLFKMWQCRKLGLVGMNCWWDAEEDYRYTKVERPFHAGVVYVILALACVGALWVPMKLTELPRNRGELIVAEFSQNYNQFRSRFTELGFDNVPKLDSWGRWQEERRGPVSTHTGSASYNASDGTTWTIEKPVEGATVWLPLEFTMKDDRISAVTIRMESHDSIIGESRMRNYLVLAAMSGAADGQNLFHFDATDGLFTMADLECFEDLEMDYWGLHISQQVDYEGYGFPGEGSDLWALEEDAPRRFERVMTISLPEP